MSLVKAKGNMYEWVSHLWNPIRGCSHQCSYCYVKNFGGQPRELTLLEPFPNLGRDKTIFVGHLCDMWAKEVSMLWIEKILEHCLGNNQYIFQTKNPHRLFMYVDSLPFNSIVGTTIETNDEILLSHFSKAPRPFQRAVAMSKIGIKKFVTIEPIMKFKHPDLLNLILLAKPDFVNIGADSKRNNLPEPSKAEVLQLIECIKLAGIEVREKENLKRLLK